MDKDMQIDPDSQGNGGFVFSDPNIVPSPEKPFNFGGFSDNAFGTKFTFANPDTIESTDHMEDADIVTDNTSTPNFNSTFASQNTEQKSIFGKGIEANRDNQSLFNTQTVQTNVFANAVKSNDNVTFPFPAPVAQQTNIFSTNSQPSENYTSPLRNQEADRNIFSASAKSNEDHKPSFGVQSGKQDDIFKTPFGTKNSENTNVFAPSVKANDDPFGVKSTVKSDVFSVPAKSSDNSESPFATQESNVLKRTEESISRQKSPLDTEKKKVAKSKAESASSSGTRAKVRDRRSRSSESDSSFSARDLKKSELFAQLKKNTKKNDEKLDISKSITCFDIPDSLIEKDKAKEHLERFGKTRKITIKPRRKMIIVYYETDDGALRAFKRAGEYEGEEFRTDWTTKEIFEPKPKKKESVKKKIASFLNIDDETKEELEALRGIPSDYNLPGSKNLQTLAAKAKLKKTRELTNKAITQKTKSLVKATKPLMPKLSVPVVQERKLPSKEEPPSPIEPPVETKAILKITSAQIEEMQNLIRQPGNTAEERYKILDARDKLMRLKRQKQKSLATAKVTKGTCQDMCPEKERYMREFQRQVFSYEQPHDSDEYRIDHSLAVKQYSRSSADQEEPMPHDLRPVKSLRLTMSYLLHEIADLCEEEGTSLEEWYHFLWDRTRSIRKDITQQELCCLETVEMVEQCARFHIVASERLCAEGTSVFDPKINSENLTKCLQSLKYMYDDLKENSIVCSNEAEFRAYIVLLNLNNGSFISELRTLTPSVQRSPEVKFALDVYSAMDMNNFSRFFKLVRQTSYLNACILLRYFNQVRVRAFTTIVKAYCRTNTPTEYPLYELIDILGFEDEDEVYTFCQRVGLKCDRDNMCVKLKKETFHEPDSNLDQNRAYNLVLSKRLNRNQAVGECIAGGTWPEKLYERYKPHNSFNSQGYLQRAAINAQDQNLQDLYDFREDDDDVEFVSATEEKKVVANSVAKPDKPVNAFKPPTTTTPFIFRKPEPAPTSTFTFTKPEPVPTSTFMPNKLVPPKTTTQSIMPAKPTVPSIFSSSSNAATTSSIFGQQPTQPTMAFNAFKPTTPSALPTTSAFNTTVNASIFSGGAGHQTNLFKPPTALPPVAALPEPPKKIDTQSGNKERTPIKRPLENATESSVQEKKQQTERHELLKKKLEAELRLKAEREKLELLESISASSTEEYHALEAEVMDEMCASIVEAELERIELMNSLGERMYEGMLNELCEEILDEQLFVQDMLIEVERRLRDRLLLKYCRAWKQWAAKRRAQRREALDNTPVWLQPSTLEECAKRLYNPQQKIAIKYARECRRRSGSQDKEARRVKHAPIEFIISVGLKENAKSFDVEAQPRNFWKMVVSWPLLDNRLTLWRHKKTVNKYLSPSDFTQEPIFIEHKPSVHERLDICIRYFEGLICENCLTGMDALLFVIFGDEDERSIQQRLTKTILGRGKLPPIPLVVVVFGDDEVDPHAIRVSAVLETVLESGHVSEYTILHERSIDENVVLRVFQSATLWLAINRSPAVPLEMDYLKRVFDDCLTEELWLRIQGHLSHDPRFSEPLNDPNFIINLHNEAVNYVTDIIMDNESMSYTDFAPELKIYLDNKRPYPCTFEHFDPVWKHTEYRAELVNIMSSFIFPPWRYEWPIRDMMQLHDAIVNYARQLLSYENSLAVTSNILSDLFLIAGFTEDSRPNFADILLHIMEKKISEIPGNTRVVYNKNHVKHFQTLPWWFKSNALVEYMANCDTDMPDDSDNPVVQEITASTSQMDLDFDCDIDELNETCKDQDEMNPVKTICEEVRTHISEVQSVADLLDKQLEEQKLKNEDFEARLKAALGDEFISDDS